MFKADTIELYKALENGGMLNGYVFESWNYGV